MNTYLVPIYDDNDVSCKIKKYIATSIDDCKEKIMQEYSDKYNVDWDNWKQLLSEIWPKYGICIGWIYDVEELC